MTHYELLAVDPNISEADLKKTFKKLAGALHIDRFLRFDIPEDTLEILKQLFIAINRAYQVLVDPEQRNEYNLELEQGLEGNESNQPDLESILHAEQLTRDAVKLLQQGHIDRAAEKIQKAQPIIPDNVLVEAIHIYTSAMKLKAKSASALVIRQHAERLDVLTQQHQV